MRRLQGTLEAFLEDMPVDPAQTRFRYTFELGSEGIKLDIEKSIS